MLAYHQPKSGTKQSRWDIDYQDSFYLSFGEQFDQSTFGATDQSFLDSIIEHLRQLRSQKKYIRFWFSGGKDSRLVMDAAVKGKIYFDEIAMIKPLVFGPGVHIGGPAEIKMFAEPLAAEYQRLFPQTKISLITLTDEHFQTVYNDKTWYKKTHHYYYTTVTHLNLFYSHINPKFNFVSTEQDCDLQGFEAPHIWFDNGWKFCYIDNQFNDTWPLSHRPIDNQTVSAFLTEVIGQLQSMEHFPKQFQNKYTSRSLKNLTSAYSSIVLDYEYPKYFSPTTQDSYWVSCTGFKDYLMNTMAILYDPKIKSWHTWAYDTNWDEIKQDVQRHGILSKEFLFNLL